MTSPKKFGDANLNQKMEKVVLEILRLPDLQIRRQEFGGKRTGVMAPVCRSILLYTACVMSRAIPLVSDFVICIPHAR
jgi:hypothetical protein